MGVRFESLLKAASPPHGAKLLLKVIAANDSDALAAWREWISVNTIAGATGAERRLLAAVGRRLLNLETDPDHKAALAAVKRDVWRINQLRLNGHLWILRRLADAGVPTMILKGGARIASEPGAMETRVIRDIDLLFPSDRLTEALETLIALGLRSVNGNFPGMVKSQAFAPIRPAGPRPADYLEIDVHSAPLRLGRRGYYDNDLWQRAEKAELLGVPVFVPSASDRYLHAIAHGLLADEDRPFDWAVDALVALRHERFDPAVVRIEIRRRRLGVPIAIGSTLLGKVFGAEVPDIVIGACRRDLVNPLFRFEMAGTLVLGRERTLRERLLVGFAERFRTFLRPSPPRTWKTKWIVRPSLRRSSGAWATFSNGRVETILPSRARVGQGRLIVFFTWEGKATADHSFDLLLDGIWIGRLQIYTRGLLALLPRRAWRSDVRYRFPAALVRPGPALLTVVALDERKMPAVLSRPVFRVTAHAF